MGIIVSTKNKTKQQRESASPVHASIRFFLLFTPPRVIGGFKGGKREGARTGTLFPPFPCHTTKLLESWHCWKPVFNNSIFSMADENGIPVAVKNSKGEKAVNSFIREKVIHCGPDFIAPAVFPYSKRRQQAAQGKRGKKQKVSEPKQKNLNDKTAKRYFIQLANANFGKDDLAVHLSYAPEHLPDTYEAARKIAVLYLGRVAYRRETLGLPPLKYLLITQLGRKKDGTHRIHHHILMNGGLDRDEVESMWWKEKETKKREAVLYGWANADRLKPNRKGIAQMAGYMVQDSLGKKHWTQSHNLEKPWSYNPNDNKYTRRQIEKIAKIPPDSEDFRKFWERQYKGWGNADWELVEIEKQYNEQTGWAFYLTMRRKC